MPNSMQNNYATRQQVEALLEEARSAASQKGPRRARADKKPTGFKRALRILANAAYAAAIGALLLALYVGVEAKLNGRPASLMGYSLFVVETGSMVPTLPIGSYILVQAPDDPAALAEGTIITFYNTSGSIITHRIIEVVEQGGIRYRTKGDNPLNSPDAELVAPERVLGALRFSVALPKVWQEQ
jgi:signal peptidase